MNNEITRAQIDLYEEDRIIYFSVKSPGKISIKDWRTNGRHNKYSVTGGASAALNSPTIRITKKVKYKIAVLRSCHMPNPEIVTTACIREAGLKRGFKTPTPEVALLMREHLLDIDIEKMGLEWITVMHKPIMVQGGILLSVGGDNTGRPKLNGVFISDAGWIRYRAGWAFLVTEVS